MHMNSKTVEACTGCTQSLHRFKPDGIPALRASNWHSFPSLRCYLQLEPAYKKKLECDLICTLNTLHIRHHTRRMTKMKQTQWCIGIFVGFFIVNGILHTFTCFTNLLIVCILCVHVCCLLFWSVLFLLYKREKSGGVGWVDRWRRLVTIGKYKTHD